ncbi:MAG: hypothetical protein AAF823_16005 [Planctomycetota bacterium]
MDDRERLFDHLAQHEAACPVCGYRLHQLQSDRCPECGTHLRLTVGSDEPRLNAWLLIVVSGTAALTSGLYWAFFIALDARQAIAYGDPLGYGLIDFLITASLIAAGIPAVIALPLRRAFADLSLATQWALSRLATGFAALTILADLTYNFANY